MITQEKKLIHGKRQVVYRVLVSGAMTRQRLLSRERNSGYPSPSRTQRLRNRSRDRFRRILTALSES